MIYNNNLLDIKPVEMKKSKRKHRMQLFLVVTYEEGDPAHFAWAENMYSGIKGLKLGVSKLDKVDRSKVGAAIFAEWTTSEDEEQKFIREWSGMR